MKKIPIIKTFFILSLVILVGLCLSVNLAVHLKQQTILSRFKPERFVRLSGPVAKECNDSAAVRSEKTVPEFRVAIAPIFSPEVSQRLYEEMVEYLGGALHMRGVILQRRTYVEINELLRVGGCHIAIVCTYPFIRGEKDFGMELLAVPQFGGKTTYQALVIVSRDNPARSLMDLRGKRFVSAHAGSSTGWLYPANWLADHGANPRAFFSALAITGSNDGSIEAVAKGNADGASVHSIVFDQMIYEDSTLLEKIKVIQRSPDYGAPPIVVHPKMDPVFKARIASALLQMNETPEGKMALARLRIDRYIKPEGDIYRSVRVAAVSFEAFK